MFGNIIRIAIYILFWCGSIYIYSHPYDLPLVHKNGVTIFGLSSNTPLDDLDKGKDWNRHTGFLNSVPEPHPYFDNYFVRHFQTTGICEFQSWGPTHTESIGRGRFLKLISQVKEVYGDPVNFHGDDGIGSRISFDKELLSSIERKRVYWEGEEFEKEHYPLTQINLGYSSGGGTDFDNVGVSFRLSNYEQCMRGSSGPFK